MSWDEFTILLSGIAAETPLGHIVSIRAETDKEVIKNFSKDQRKIYNQWRNKNAAAMDVGTYERSMAALEKTFQDMCR